MENVPQSFPRLNGIPWPLDADAALVWLETASPAELDWYYNVMLDVPSLHRVTEP